MRIRPCSHRCARGVGRPLSCSLWACPRQPPSRPPASPGSPRRPGGRGRGCLEAVRQDRRGPGPLVRGAPRRAAGLPGAQRRGQDHHHAHDPGHHPARPGRSSASSAARRAWSTSQRVGYLPEDRGLYRDVPVVETLTYFGALRGMSTVRQPQAGHRPAGARSASVTR